MSFKKKKYVFAVIMIFSVIFMFGMTARHEKLHAEGIGVVSVKGYLNVRTGPGTYYSKLKYGGTGVVLSDGQRVTVVGKNGSWYHIKFKQNSKNLSGYVNKKYLKFKTGKTYSSIVGYIASGVYVRKNMNTAKVYIKHDKEKIKLPVKRKVRIYSEKYAEKKRWYYASFKYDGKTYK